MAWNLFCDPQVDCLERRGAFLSHHFGLLRDRVILGSTIWRSGFPSFVLGHFFLLGVGLGLDIKWAGVPISFGPTPIITKNEMFFSNLESILEIKLENFIISFFDISFNLIYIIIIFIHHDLNKLLNSYTSHLMSILYKSSTNKYMIMVKNVIYKIMKNMIKLFFFWLKKKKNLFKF